MANSSKEKEEKVSPKLVTIQTDIYEETAATGIANSTKRNELCTETKAEAGSDIGDHNPITYNHQKDTLPIAQDTPEEVPASRETSQERNENKEASSGSSEYFIDSKETADVNLSADIEANMEIEIGCLILFQEARTVHSPKEPDCEYYGYTCS